MSRSSGSSPRTSASIASAARRSGKKLDHALDLVADVAVAANSHGVGPLVLRRRPCGDCYLRRRQVNRHPRLSLRSSTPIARRSLRSRESRRAVSFKTLMGRAEGPGSTHAPRRGLGARHSPCPLAGFDAESRSSRPASPRSASARPPRAAGGAKPDAVVERRRHRTIMACHPIRRAYGLHLQRGGASSSRRAGTPRTQGE